MTRMTREETEMPETLRLDVVDADGAIREAADAVGGDTRARFLAKAGLLGGGLVGSSALLGLNPAIAGAKPSAKRDVAILNFALTLEHLEATFYAEALRSGALSGELLLFAQVVAGHERQHVLALKKVLGRKAVKAPRFNFRGTTEDAAQFTATAQVLEDTGVHAYLGQVPNIKTKAVLLGAGRILPVEARHAAWIRDIRYSGGNSPATTPAPAAFEDPFSRTRILSLVKSTGFIVG
jgi:ferritin-like protein